MIAVVLEIEHLRRIKVREYERVDQGDTLGSEEIEGYLASDYKKAVLNKDGDVVFCFGGKLMGEGGWVWMVASDLLYKNPVASIEMILKLHEEGMQMFRPKFAYTFNHPDFPVAIRFLERLGYKEGGRAQFKDGVERIIMVKEFPLWAAR